MKKWKIWASGLHRLKAWWKYHLEQLRMALPHTTGCVQKMAVCIHGLGGHRRRLGRSFVNLNILENLEHLYIVYYVDIIEKQKASFPENSGGYGNGCLWASDRI